MQPVNVFEDRGPLYQRIAEKLSAAIQQGVYPVGGMLPTEAELCDQFRVSRHTIREAIRLLLQLGMVSRHHGIGTRVERNSVVQHYVQTLGSIPDLWQYVKETRRQVLAVSDVAAGDAQVPLPGDPALRWRMLEGLRFAEREEQPIAWTQVYVHPIYAAVIDSVERDAIPVYSLIERQFGIKTRGVWQEISGIAIPGEIAQLLKLPPGSVGLSILRQYLSTRDEVFEVTLSVHPADRYRYTMQLDLAYTSGVAGEGGEP